MTLSYKSYQLQFKYPFGVSGYTRKETTSVFVRLEEGGVFGYGEACLPAYLGETENETIHFFHKASNLVAKINSDSSIENLMDGLDAIDAHCNAAKAAIDIAYHDLCAKIKNQSFCEWKNIEPTNGVETSITIGIDSEKILLQKLEECRDFKLLKIKAGTKDDKLLIEFIRKHTNQALYIDVNQGWKTKEEAARMSDWLSKKNVLLLEQPLSKTMDDEMEWLTARSPIPTFADESIKRLKDLEKIGKSFSGINIKLMKCTGIHEAIKMIAYCKTHKLKILLGCMAESACGTSAMAQLMTYADFVDLDAPLLYSNNPFDGVVYENGKIYLQRGAGISAVPNRNIF